MFFVQQWKFRDVNFWRVRNANYKMLPLASPGFVRISLSTRPHVTTGEKLKSPLKSDFDDFY
jgi:hypothetical protein